MAQGKFSDTVHADPEIFGTLSVKFIDEFLSTKAPVECVDKRIMLGQGALPKVFKNHRCQVLATAPDAINQNSVVNMSSDHCQCHERAMIKGTNLLTSVLAVNPLVWCSQGVQLHSSE